MLTVCRKGQNKAKEAGNATLKHIYLQIYYVGEGSITYSYLVRGTPVFYLLDLGRTSRCFNRLEHESTEVSL